MPYKLQTFVLVNINKDWKNSIFIITHFIWVLFDLISKKYQSTS